MNKTKVLWISTLLYRIKDNTRMFFLITITSAMAFTSIGAVSAFGSIRRLKLIKIFLKHFLRILQKDYNELDFIEGSLKKKVITIQKFKGILSL